LQGTGAGDRRRDAFFVSCNGLDYIEASRRTRKLKSFIPAAQQGRRPATREAEMRAVVPLMVQVAAGAEVMETGAGTSVPSRGTRADASFGERTLDPLQVRADALLSY